MKTTVILEALAPLLEYPGPDYQSLIEGSLTGIGAEDYPDVAGPAHDHLRLFADAVRPLTREEIEELYTRTFDLNPTCSLDIGWHLYGEQYARGDFLVRLRDALRAHAIDEATELPDHLPSVLRLLSRSSEGEAEELSRTAVQPAITKMLSAFKDDSNPYSSLLRAVLECAVRLCPQEIGENDHD